MIRIKILRMFHVSPSKQITSNITLSLHNFIKHLKGFTIYNLGKLNIKRKTLKKLKYLDSSININIL